jgi:outer membrane receptor for ferrienterochelin and colicin
VVFPAEAFLYGGRSLLVMPNDVPGFETKRGNPETQIGLAGNYQFGNGIGLTFATNYFSSVYTGRLMLVELPSTQTFDAGVFWDFNRFHVKVDVLNLTDERYFRARTGDTLSDALASAMPGRRWQATIRAEF